MSRARGIVAAACALYMVAAPAGAPETAAARAGARPNASAASAGAVAKDGTARRRCRVRAARRRCLRRRALVFHARAELPRTRRLSALVAGPGAPGSSGSGSGSGSSGDPGPGGDSGGGSTPALGRFVSVSAREWSFTLSRPIVGAGAVTVELRNVGEDPHNLVVSPDDGSHTPLDSWADADPGTTVRRSLTLGAGRYRLWCSLAGHEQAGMAATLVVQ